MWVAKFYKNFDFLYLWNRKPEKVSNAVNNWCKENGVDECEYDNHHGFKRIDERYNPMFEGLEQPIEVELVRDDSKTPMFYAQKILDSKGNEQIYLNTHLEYKYHAIHTKGVLWKRKYKSNVWSISSKQPEKDYADLTINVSTDISTDSHRIRPKDFPWTVEDGYVPVTLKIK